MKKSPVGNPFATYKPWEHIVPWETPPAFVAGLQQLII
jgi:hypothetical protein